MKWIERFNKMMRKRHNIPESQIIYTCIGCDRSFEEGDDRFLPLKKIGEVFLIYAPFFCEDCRKKGLLKEKKENERVAFLADKLNLKVADVKFLVNKKEG